MSVAKRIISLINVRTGTPVLPVLPKAVVQSRGGVFIPEATAEKSAYYTTQVFPLTLVLDGEEWTLPIEPTISLKLNNNIVKRNVAKGKLPGTIKERWSQGDWSISISGVFQGKNGEYPREDIEQLYRYVNAGKAIQVLCEPLQIRGIHAMVVDDVSEPFTKGIDRQRYEIQAVSDFSYDLFIELNS